MKGIVGRIVVGVITGAACQAGIDLWNNVLSEKVQNIVRNSKKSIPNKGKSNKIFSFFLPRKGDNCNEQI